MVAGVFSVGTTSTAAPLSIEQFYPEPPKTPGNVGVALSGGGSRALTAGMGQLRALNQLTMNGRPLLAQIKALSTVSGGAWLGVPFVYLPPGSPSDTAYLGPWIEDQSNLTPAMLAHLPAGNAGVPISSPLFSPKLLAVQALLLHGVLKVPPSMLWQTIIGLNILSAYGLYAPTIRLTPTDTFSFDRDTVASQVTSPTLNPALSSEPIDLYADALDPTRTHRPFLICNCAMFLSEPTSSFQMLAPVQITPFISGVFGAPRGEDANGQAPGGGGVSTFGFNSAYISGSGSTTVAQNRQWSLTDAVGTSSAFFAEVLQNIFQGWRQDPADLAAVVASHANVIQHWIRTRLPIEARRPAVELLNLNAHPMNYHPLLQAVVADLQKLIPRYQYWPVRDTQPTARPTPSEFADGGNLENTGVAALLAYSDINRIVAFINPMTVLEVGAYGVANGSGGFFPGTQVIVDTCIPPLFGYQPYEKGGLGANEGYVLYGEGTSTRYQEYSNSQVFESTAFSTLLQGLWAASGGGSYARPAVFEQQLTVRPNTWFGVTSAREVTVVWFYLAFVTEWETLFAEPVRTIIEGERMTNGFPNYSTLATNLTATQINLLANLAAWSAGEAERATGVLSGLFR